MPIPGRLVIIREGHGEAGAIENLVARTAKDMGLYPGVISSIPDSPRHAITTPESAIVAARIAATLDPAAALLTADREDGCPSVDAPVLAREVAAVGLKFPVAVVLFYREFETLAVSVAPTLGGRELKSPAGQVILTMTQATSVPANPEDPRDAKGWVADHLMGGQAYKPTVHQLPLTRAMRIDELRAAGLSSFRRLENALRFLGGQIVSGGRAVYPSADTA